MTVPAGFLAVILVVFGFLSGSTFYFYNKSRSVETKTHTATGFQADLSMLAVTPSPQPVDTLTQPAEPKNRLSYPAHTFKVPPKQSLASVGTTMQVPWQIIKQANGIQNENVVQADYPLVIPKKNVLTGYYRVEFRINQEKLAQITQETRSVESSEWFSALDVAKKQAPPYFAVSGADSFTLLEQNDSQATAAVSVKKDDDTIVIGLVQPGEKGKRGVWALYYVEQQTK